MANQEREPLFKLGDRVEVRHSNKRRARIVELRGPLGPGGTHIYRIRTKRWPKPIYTEVARGPAYLASAEAATGRPDDDAKSHLTLASAANIRRGRRRCLTPPRRCGTNSDDER